MVARTGRGEAHQVVGDLAGGDEVRSHQGGQVGVGAPFDDVGVAGGQGTDLLAQGVRISANGDDHLGARAEGRFLGGSPDGDEARGRVGVGRRWVRHDSFALVADFSQVQA